MAVNEAHAASLDRALRDALRTWTAANMPGQLPGADLVMAVMVRSMGAMFDSLPNDGDKVQLASDVIEAMVTLCGVPPAAIQRYRQIYRNDALRVVLPGGNA